MNKLKKIKIFVAFLKKYDIIYLGSVFFGITRISLREQANILLNSMYLFFLDLEEQYKENVNIITLEV